MVYPDGMRYLEATLPTLAENLALDEALLLEAEAGRSGEVLRLWEWPQPAVVLGSGGKLLEDVDEAACSAANVPILRRSSGGGTVLLGQGCLCYSLVLAYERSPALREIPSSYEYILQRICAALAGLLPDIEHVGTSDLAAGGWKFSGNSQQRKRTHVLHHGTLLHAFDRAAIGRYLRQPARQPDYRQGREHAAFVRNLPAESADLRRRLRETWRAEMVATDWPHELVEQLVGDKHGTAAWIRRR